VPVSPCHPHPLIPAPARRLRAGVKFLLLDLPLYRTRYRSVPLANFIEISLFLVRVFDPLHCNLTFNALTTLYGRLSLQSLRTQNRLWPIPEP
jgi:hypothetical protein